MELKNINRASELIVDIWKIYQNTNVQNDYRIFNNTGKGANSNSASHRIRLFHDQFGWDAWQSRCNDVFYVTEQFKEEMTGNGEVHGEHLIPVNLLSKYIYFWLKPKSPIEIFDFLLFNSIVVGVSKYEEKNVLNQERTIYNLTKKWSKDHPNFRYTDGRPTNCEGVQMTISDINPFNRYAGLNLKVINKLNSEPIDIKMYKLQYHYQLIKMQYGKMIEDVHIKLNEYED
ncbi:MAG TPA: hypothetical protein DCM04_06045 [Saprospirales bacterium]|nr:hypothetical protein [Saprospirales bacterium]|tara:strand:+ start:45 stop:734 length:690 start_codon:yes stop_codon:yes gene_type:complete